MYVHRKTKNSTKQVELLNSKRDLDVVQICLKTLETSSGCETTETQ